VFLAALALAFLPTSDDVVIVVLDDVSQVALEDASSDMPTLLDIASDGFVFWNAHSMPICGPSRRSLLRAAWDISGQTAAICSVGDPMALPEKAVVGAEFFPGHAAGMFGKWHAGGHPDSGDWELTPQAHGFDVWDGMAINVVNCGGDSYTQWKRANNGNSSLVFNQYQPSVTLSSFEAWWAETESPRFAVVATQLPHDPFHRPPASFLPSGYPTTPDDQARYRAMLVANDHVLAEILSSIDLETTTLVIVGDNGTPVAVGGEKGTTREGGTHVPLIFAGAGIPQGASTSIVSIVDVIPTLIGQAAGDGQDLGPLMEGKVTKVHDYILTGQEEDQHWPYDVACHGLRYVLRRTDAGEELYDLLTDPGQTTNLLGTPALAVKELAMRSWLDAHLP
jgi:arylsulfatase A-like enzyme